MPFARRFSTPRGAECKAERKCLSRNLQKDNICALTKGLIMKKLILLAVSAVVLAGCATEPVRKQTVSGKAEAEYNQPLAVVKSAAVVFCNNSGGSLDQETERMVVCSREKTDGEGVMFQALIGNSYSTTPLVKIKFTFTEKDGVTKVWASQSMETQMAMGQLKKIELNGGKAVNRTQYILDNELPKYF